MNKRPTLYFALVALALIAAMFYYVYESNKPKYDWTEGSWKKKGYDEKNDQPYGTQILHRLLDGYFPGKKLTDIKENPGRELPLDSSATGQNYVFVGEAMFMDSLSTKRLLDFVALGNTAFIASKTIPFDLMTFVYFEECEEAPWTDYGMFEDSLAWLSLRTPALPDSVTKFFFAKQNQPHSYGWHYIEYYHFCDSLPQYPLGYLNKDYVNFAEFPHGKGRFLLHTNPIVFSNFSVMRAETRPYLKGVLSHLSEGNIYWDAASRVPEAVGRKRNGSMFGNRSMNEEHPLSYILKQPALAWTWYLIAVMALSWLIFRAKRRQRVIPVLPKNENSSYEFISTIAHLHFREKNYKGLSAQGMHQFLAHLRERYGLVAPMDPETGLPRTDDAFFQKLAALSEVPEAEARRLFGLHANTVRYEPTEEMAVDLYLAIEAFLKVAK
ncbi:MAG TPA: hypothetical protein VK168_05795 [Saprospiraceae bacterium]|nr:hypothetical protein [Saprospiraceae bacterium]